MRRLIRRRVAKKIDEKMNVASASARCYESACRDPLWNCKTSSRRKFTFNEKARSDYQTVQTRGSKGGSGRAWDRRDDRDRGQGFRASERAHRNLSRQRIHR